MVRHPRGILIALLIPAILAGAVLSPAEEYAYDFQINANGAVGELALSTEPGGRIRGTLLGSPVEGWLMGRRLVLFREVTDGREAWEAWMATPVNVQGDDHPILAGTFLRPGEDGPLPWFAISESQMGEAEILAVAPLATGGAEQLQEQAAPESQAEVTPPTKARVQDQHPEQQKIQPVSAPAPVPHLPSGKPSLAGTWDTPDGPLTIRQEGSSLTFILPDREISGRLTGSDSLIGGFGPGCCKGHLEQEFAVITWDNGVSWYRK